MQKIIITPTGTFPAALNAYFAKRILFDEAKGKSAKDSEVFRCMSHAHSAVILTK
jgi:hypothetical protein